MSTKTVLPPHVAKYGDLLAATAAKVLASAIFVSHRDPEEAIENSVTLPRERNGQTWFTVSVDQDTRSVELTLAGGISRTAQCFGDQGCVILPAGKQPFFEPVAVTSSLPAAEKTEWPLGDVAPAATQSPLGATDLDQAIEVAFANPDDCTAAVVVVHRGQIVAERYREGIGRDTQLESWSMGKTITALLIGLLIEAGEFSLDDPAPVPAWRRSRDPRGAIRIRDLLQMSSGLEFSSNETSTWVTEGYPDHTLVYTGAVDVLRFAISRPAEHPPQTVGRYRNCDPLSLGWILQQCVRARGDEYLTWPQQALFDRIGIRRQVLETDAYGNFVMTGFDYGTARNWARIGLLVLNDGCFLGERLLPEGYVDFMKTPAPAWAQAEYGGQVWVNGAATWDLPRDAFNAAGAGGQHTFVVPSHDLVIVRMGHRRGGETYAENLKHAQRLIIDAVERS